jgi:choice-of-anchor B domain-containing protein
MAGGSVATDWREPKVYGNYAYIGVDGTNHPIQVVNLTQLRNYSGTTLTLAATNFRGNGNTLNKAHTLAINPASGFLYAARTNKYSGGLMAIDVRNPANPVEAGGYSGDGLTHESQVVIYNGPDAQYRGREIAFNSNAKSGSAIDTFSIVDITSKTAPARLSSQTYTGARWIHQGWLTDDHRYFLQNDESDESGGVTGGHTRTHLWDVADLNDPVYRGFYDHATTSIDHNLYIKGNYVYMTNYTTGLRILEIDNFASSNPADWMHEVGFFDTYPANDGQTFNGAWNNYPFFESGNVIVSDIDGGLFVLRPELAAMPSGPVAWPGWDIASLPEPGVAGALALWLVGCARRRGAPSAA